MCGTPHFVVMVVRNKSSNIEQMVQQSEMEILFPIIKLPNFRFDIIIIIFRKNSRHILQDLLNLSPEQEVPSRPDIHNMNFGQLEKIL